jgi:hypothetical protein
MEYFVQQDSVVRKIWGTSDIILFIFAGSAAEFALSKAVDWLYFTGKLPEDPLGRLFSTVEYARQIVFSEKETAEKAIDTMAKIHAGVEGKRGATIPDWAYRDVLFMLIDYSIRSFELLERKLTPTEKEEVFDVFNRVGLRMGLVGLPSSYPQWLGMRQDHLFHNLEKSHYTTDLFQQYKKHLGALRYRVLLEAQLLVVPRHVKKLLKMGKVSALLPVVPFYRFSRKIHLDWILKELLLPGAYKAQIKALDRVPG